MFYIDDQKFKTLILLQNYYFVHYLKALFER